MNKPYFSKARGFASMTLLLFMGLSGFILWAALFEIDQSVRAQGQAIPDARTQIIQSADGGVLSLILVQEGEAVKAGQRLAVLERERPRAAVEESRAKAMALQAALARTQAEANNAPFTRNTKRFGEFEAVQLELFEQRKRSLQEELATLQDALDLAQEELKMNEALFKMGDTSRLEVMRSKRQVGELQGRMSAARNKYQQDARQEATKIAEELSSSRYKLEERQSVLNHTEINAPVAGVVKYLKVTTIGGVLRPGDELMHISPTDGDLIIEVKITPVDIGQLKIGLPVSVKLDAFDYSLYGALVGSLTYISSDTLLEQIGNGQSAAFYRAQIRLDSELNKANPKLASVAIKPGMTATVDIRTSSRTILQYLVKPIFKAFGGALNER